MTPLQLQRLKHTLARNISGRVLDQGDDEYARGLDIDNGRISLEPALVVVPDAPHASGSEGEEARSRLLVRDVAETVRICHSEGVRVTAKSGGHGASGYCLNNGGVVLDLKHLNWIQFDKGGRTLRAGLGQRFRRIYDYLEMNRSGLIPIGGGCPTVGLGGFLLGGGYSFVSRSYGLGADNVSAFKVVLADGSVREVSVGSTDSVDKELFWALRGGGGGNFGVAVEATLQCHAPNATTMLTGNILFPFHRLPEILDYYNRWAPSLPDNMAVYGYLGSQADPRMPGDQPLSIRFTPIFNGSFSDGVDLLRGLLALGPISTQLYNMTLPEWEDLIASGTEVRGRSAYIRSVMMAPGTMTRDVADVFMFYMNRRPSTDSFVVWTHAGGAVTRVNESQTAFPHRNALFVPEVKSIWRSDRPEDTRPNVEWAVDFFDSLAVHGIGAYVNYIDPLQKEWTRKYYGANYARLVALQEVVDPDRFFHFQQGIGSPFEPNLDRPIDLSPLELT